jgi:PAS domain S-box-containing protein
MPEARPNGGSATGPAAARAPDLDELTLAVRESNSAVALVDIDSFMVRAASRRMADAVGSSYPVGNVDVRDLVVDADRVGRNFAAVRDGQFDGYEVSRKVRRLDGRLIDAGLWVRGVERRLPRRYALIALDLRQPPATAVPEQHAVGSLDAEHRVAQVSAEAHDVMGATADAVIGQHMAELVHPDDVAPLLRTLAAAVDQRDGAGNEVRVRGSDGEFHPVHVTACPIDGTSRVGFCATRGGGDMTGARVAELERHLTRIAREIEAAGLIRSGMQIPDPERVPGLADLTAKQWEVVTRLLRGERVASIARAMYLSPSTVRNYLSAIYRKIGVHSQAELLERLLADDEA